MEQWYASGNDRQGLIISEATGATIAVSYDPKHENLIAAAPDLLQACKYALETLENITTADFELGKDKPAREKLQAAINKAMEE